MVVDEAYVDFGAESAVPLVARHDNLLVIQTFSKSRSLAGLRVGFAIGQRPLIEALERVKDSFNSYPVDCLAIAGAVAAIEDDGWFAETRARIIASRETLARELDNSASRCCRRSQTSSSRAIEAGAEQISRQRFASVAFWSGISESRASRTSCASRSGRRPSVAGLSKCCAA